MSYIREYHPCAISLLKDGSPFRLSTPNHFETLEDAKDVLASWVTDPNYIVLATWVDTVCISEWEVRGRKRRSESINKVSWREYPSNYRRFSMTVYLVVAKYYGKYDDLMDESYTIYSSMEGAKKAAKRFKDDGYDDVQIYENDVLTGGK